MPTLLLELFSSKKFVTMLGGAILFVLNSKLNLGVDTTTMNEVLVIISSYIVGQGISDHGKSVQPVSIQPSTQVSTA